MKGTTTEETSWLSVNAGGDVYVDINVRAEKEVFVRSTWAQDSST